MNAGRVELNLNRMPSPAKSAAYCTLDMLPDYLLKRDPNEKPPFFTKEWPYVTACVPKYRYKPVDMFEARRLRGFWPCYKVDDEGVTTLAVHTYSTLTHTIDDKIIGYNDY